MDPAVTFPGYRADTPLLWALVALATLEMLVVHLFVWLKWPGAAWVLTALSAAFLVWLVRLIRSLKRFPHSIESDRLHLCLGSLRTVAVPIDHIAGIRTSWGSGAAKTPGVANLVLISAPNRIIDVAPPIAGRRRPVSAVAISVDDPPAFDAALAARGVRVA